VIVPLPTLQAVMDSASGHCRPFRNWVIAWISAPSLWVIFVPTEGRISVRMTIAVFGKVRRLSCASRIPAPMLASCAEVHDGLSMSADMQGCDNSTFLALCRVLAPFAEFGSPLKAFLCVI
jgi:hypothetical protein